MTTAAVASLSSAVAFVGNRALDLPRRCVAMAADADVEGGPPRRRDVAGATLAAQAAAVAWLQSPAAANAEDTMSAIIKESRRKAKEDALKPSIFNPNSYKTPTGKYDASNLQSFLPTVYLAKRAFEATLTQLDNPKVNVSDINVYEALREQNRLEPTKLLRKDAFRTKLWLREKAGKTGAADTEYERIKRALDDEDTQCLIVSRTEGLVDEAAVRITKRNVQDVVDAIDGLLELIPEDDQVAAKAVADTQTIPVLKLPYNDIYKNTAEAAAAPAEAAM